MKKLKAVRRTRIIFTFMAVGVIALTVILINTFMSQASESKGIPSDYNAVIAVPTNFSEKATEIPGVANDHTSTSFFVKNRMGPDQMSVDFSIEYPASWNLKSIQKVYGSTLLLSRDGYELYINQAVIDNVGSCEFGDELAEGTFGSNLERKDYTQIRSEYIVYRRVLNPTKYPDKTFMYFCENLSEGYGYPDLGIITYTAPKNYDPAILSEMDSMIRSVQFRAK